MDRLEEEGRSGEIEVTITASLVSLAEFHQDGEGVWEGQTR